MRIVTDTLGIVRTARYSLSWSSKLFGPLSSSVGGPWVLMRSIVFSAARARFAPVIPRSRRELRVLFLRTSSVDESRALLKKFTEAGFQVDDLHFGLSHRLASFDDPLQQKRGAEYAREIGLFKEVVAHVSSIAVLKEHFQPSPESEEEQRAIRKRLDALGANEAEFRDFNLSLLPEELRVPTPKKKDEKTSTASANTTEGKTGDSKLPDGATAIGSVFGDSGTPSQQALKQEFPDEKQAPTSSTSSSSSSSSAPSDTAQSDVNASSPSSAADTPASGAVEEPPTTGASSSSTSPSTASSPPKPTSSTSSSSPSSSSTSDRSRFTSSFSAPSGGLDRWGPFETPRGAPSVVTCPDVSSASTAADAVANSTTPTLATPLAKALRLDSPNDIECILRSVGIHSAPLTPAWLNCASVNSAHFHAVFGHWEALPRLFALANGVAPNSDLVVNRWPKFRLALWVNHAIPHCGGAAVRAEPLPDFESCSTKPTPRAWPGCALRMGDVAVRRGKGSGVGNAASSGGGGKASTTSSSASSTSSSSADKLWVRDLSEAADPAAVDLLQCPVVAMLPGTFALKIADNIVSFLTAMGSAYIMSCLATVPPSLSAELSPNVMRALTTTVPKGAFGRGVGGRGVPAPVSPKGLLKVDPADVKQLMTVATKMSDANIVSQALLGVPPAVIATRGAVLALAKESVAAAAALQKAAASAAASEGRKYKPGDRGWLEMNLADDMKRRKDVVDEMATMFEESFVEVNEATRAAAGATLEDVLDGNVAAVGGGEKGATSSSSSTTTTSSSSSSGSEDAAEIARKEAEKAAVAAARAASEEAASEKSKYGRTTPIPAEFRWSFRIFLNAARVHTPDLLRATLPDAEPFASAPVQVGTVEELRIPREEFLRRVRSARTREFEITPRSAFSHLSMTSTRVPFFLAPVRPAQPQ